MLRCMVKKWIKKFTIMPKYFEIKILLPVKYVMRAIISEKGKVK